MRKAWKERAEGLSLGPRAATDRGRAQGHATRDDDRRPVSRPSGRGISEGAEQPIHMRAGHGSAHVLGSLSLCFEDARLRQLRAHTESLKKALRNVEMQGSCGG